MFDRLTGGFLDQAVREKLSLKVTCHCTFIQRRLEPQSMCSETELLSAPAVDFFGDFTMGRLLKRPEIDVKIIASRKLAEPGQRSAFCG